MTKFLKPLVITDNPLLAQRIQGVVRNLGIDILNYACTDPAILEEILKTLDENTSLVNLKNEENINKIIQEFDLVISIHCKQLFPERLVQQRRCINLHPGYNPINRGWYPQVFAIIHDRIAGATLHEMDTMLDHGQIIDRVQVSHYSWDTSKTLYDRIVEAEVGLFQKNIISILNDQYSTTMPEDEGFLHLRKDFNQLCEIDLDETVTFRTALNRLRALTHGPYRNAWFWDEQTGRKIFVKIELTPEDGVYRQ